MGDSDSMSKTNMSYREIREIIDSNNKEINAKLDRLIEKTEAIHIQATKTNGRVNNHDREINSIVIDINEIKRDNKQQDQWINTQKGKLLVAGVVISLILAVGTALL